MKPGRRLCYMFLLAFLDLTVDNIQYDSYNIELSQLRACLHGGGGPQVGEVTRGESLHLSCKCDQIKMRDYVDRWVTPPKRVT